MGVATSEPRETGTGDMRIVSNTGPLLHLSEAQNNYDNTQTRTTGYIPRSTMDGASLE